MIKVDTKKGKIEIEGTKTRLLTDFAHIVRELNEAGIEKELLENNFKMGFMNKKEIAAELLKTIKSELNISESLEEIIKDVLSKEDK
jgi:hypothetical protein